jgi:hypothetical protein
MRATASWVTNSSGASTWSTGRASEYFISPCYGHVPQFTPAVSPRTEPAEKLQISRAAPVAADRAGASKHL